MSEAGFDTENEVSKEIRIHNHTLDFGEKSKYIIYLQQSFYR